MKFTPSLFAAFVVLSLGASQCTTATTETAPCVPNPCTEVNKTQCLVVDKDGFNCLCDEGYQAGVDGACAPLADPCTNDTECVLQHRFCESIGGSASCAACLEGYEDKAGVCVPVTFCQDGSCGMNGTCDASSGVIVCHCSNGYAGVQCEGCDQGFHFATDGTTCTADRCDPNPCNLANNEACSPTDGSCVCADGFHLAANGTTCTTDRCDPNPCLEVPVSDSVCSAAPSAVSGYACGCRDLHFWDETAQGCDFTCEDDQREENDSAVSPNDIRSFPGGICSASLVMAMNQNVADEDWFQFLVPPGRYRVFMQFDEVNNPALLAEIYAEDGTTLLASKDPTGLVDVVLAAGTYLLRVAPDIQVSLPTDLCANYKVLSFEFRNDRCTPTACTYGAHLTGECFLSDDWTYHTCGCEDGYEYSVSSQQCEVSLSCADQYDPGNETKATATPLAIPSNFMGRVWTVSRDWYKVDLLAGERLHLAAAVTPSDVTAAFTIQTAAGTELASFYGSSGDVDLYAKAATDGTYYINVFTAVAGTCIFYDVTIDLATDPCLGPTNDCASLTHTTGCVPRDNYSTFDCACETGWYWKDYAHACENDPFLCTPDGYEDNDDYLSAVDLTPFMPKVVTTGLTVVARAALPDDDDWYKVTAGAHQKLQILLQYTSNQYYDAHFFVYTDPLGSPIRSGTDIYVSQWFFYPESDTTYYIRVVNGYPDEDNCTPYSVTVERTDSPCLADPCATIANTAGTCKTSYYYATKFVCDCTSGFGWNPATNTCDVIACPDDAFEENDWISGASVLDGLLPFNQSIVLHKDAIGLDKDYFKFDVVLGDVVNVQATFDGGTDIAQNLVSLHLFKGYFFGDDPLTKYAVSHSLQTTGNTRTLTYTATETGTVWLLVALDSVPTAEACLPVQLTIVR